jgi:hypothetical protein
MGIALVHSLKVAGGPTFAPSGNTLFSLQQWSLGRRFYIRTKGATLSWTNPLRWRTSLKAEAWKVVLKVSLEHFPESPWVLLRNCNQLQN